MKKLESRPLCNWHPRSCAIHRGFFYFFVFRNRSYWHPLHVWRIRAYNWAACTKALFALF